MDDRRPTLGVAGGVLANLLMFGVMACAWWLHESDFDRYVAVLQEDGPFEWATFWAFMGAAGVYVAVAWRQWRLRKVLPWFAAGVALFCFVVAMEEISWAQRVFGFRPPAYFLENNFQQEANLHNVVDGFVRKRTFESVIGLFGLVLAVAGLHPGLSKVVKRLGINATPGELMPGFAAALWLYIDHPLPFYGELSELMVGLGFLFAALPWLQQGADDAGRPPPRRALLMIAAASLTTIGLGLANAAISNAQLIGDPEVISVAEAEIEALATDFRAHRTRAGFPVVCGMHRRLYTYAQGEIGSFLRDGTFAGLTAGGLPEERAVFMIDPWNSPYWIHAKCTDDSSRVSITVYSFGPNRLRNSSEWELDGDDVGVYLARVENGTDSAAQ